MISKLIFIIVTFIHLLPWIVSKNTRIGNNPAKLIALISVITILPYYAILLFNQETSILNNYIGSSRKFENLLNIFGIFYTLSMSFIYIGIVLGYKISLFKIRNNSQNYDNHHIIQIFSNICIVIGISAILLKIQQSGGFYYVVSNIANRTEVFAGTGILDAIIMPATNLSVFFLIYSKSVNPRESLAKIILTVLLFVILISLFGGRKAPIQLIITAIIASTIYIKRINLYSPIFIGVYLLIFIFFSAMLELRLSLQPGDNTTDMDLSRLLSNLSYIDTYIFIIHYFQNNDFWYGVGYLDLVQRIFPIYNLTTPPPIDDGMYIRTLFEGWQAKPSMSAENLYKSSWPPETFGAGYLNFGILGVIFFSLIKGLVTGVFYRIAKINKFEPISLFAMIMVSINFHLTNLRIVQFFVLIIGLLLFKIMYNLTIKYCYRYRHIHL